MRGPIMRFFLNEDINFLVTNRLPRRFATKLVGWLARIEHPLIARPSCGSSTRTTDEATPVKRTVALVASSPRRPGIIVISIVFSWAGSRCSKIQTRWSLLSLGTGSASTRRTVRGKNASTTMSLAGSLPVFLTSSPTLHS